MAPHVLSFQGPGWRSRVFWGQAQREVQRDEPNHTIMFKAYAQMCCTLHYSGSVCWSNPWSHTWQGVWLPQVTWQWVKIDLQDDCREVNAGDRAEHQSTISFDTGMLLRKPALARGRKKVVGIFLDLVYYPHVYMSHCSLYFDFSFNMCKFHDTNHKLSVWISNSVILFIHYLVL